MFTPDDIGRYAGVFAISVGCGVTIRGTNRAILASLVLNMVWSLLWNYYVA